MRKTLTAIGLVAALTLLPLAASAGGWGIISMDSVPGTFEPDTTYTLEYTYLAHGQTPIDAGDTQAVFRGKGGEVQRFEATNLGEGRYSVEVTLSEGSWTWGVNSDSWEIQKMGTVEVSDAAIAAPQGTGIEPLELILPIAAVLTAMFTVAELIRIRRESGHQATA